LKISEKFFPYSRIEIVEFPRGLGDPTFFEKPAITGPVYAQIKTALLQLSSVVLKERIHKLPDRPESNRVWNYPYRALEEAIVNSMYHRTWDEREPVIIRILPDSIEIINQGGPDRSVKMAEIEKGIIRNPRYRNRRIGDFLKELDMTEGRGTGIPIIRKEMKINGSPEPRFETGEDYSYFITILPIHQAFLESETLDDPINGTIKNADNELINDDNSFNGTINRTINGTIKLVFETIKNNPGINMIELIAKTGKGKTTIHRYVSFLKDNDLIIYIGARKSGGYYLTAKAKEELK